MVNVTVVEPNALARMGLLTLLKTLDWGLSEIPCLRRVEHYTERRLNRSS
jgi:hypothetical protein